MIIRNKVKIDGMEYKIIKCDTPIVDDDSKVLQGDIFYRKCEIRIDDRLNPQTSEMTLMHEIVHGIMHERNINMETPLETFVDELAKGFYNLLNDNPDMFSNKTELDEDNIGISDALADCIEPVFKIKP